MLRYALLSFVVVGPACTGGRGIDGPQNLQEALEGLGVDTTESDRVGADGEILPEDYAPLGSAMSFGDADEVSGEGGANKTDELVLLGTALAFGPDRVNVVEANGVQIGGDFTPDYGSIDVLHSIADDGNAWIDDRGLRAATAGDLDADGLDEIVIAYVDTTVAPRRLHVRVIEDGVAGFTTTDTIVGDGEGVEQLQVATGDFDGDGRHSIVVGVSLDGSAELWFLDPQEGQLAVDDAKTLVFDARNTGAGMGVELASGNLDYDNGAELGVVINESSKNGELARYVLFDDAGHDTAVLDEGNIQATDGATVVAGVGDISFGDVDGDGLDEVVLGGITQIERCYDNDAALAVLDDLRHDLALLDDRVFDPWDGFRQCPAFAEWEMDFVYVNAFDLDGDGVDELHVNQLVFEDLATAPQLLRLETPGLDDAFLLPDAQDAGQDIKQSTLSVTTGDITGDGRENLIVHAGHHKDVPVFGWSQIPEVGFAQLSVVPTEGRFNAQDRVWPLLVPANVDRDGPALIYGEGSYELVFTEPVIVATLAAAPCGDGIGQNVDACSTSFGTGDSNTVDASLTVSVKAGVHASVSTAANIPFVGEVGATFKKSVTVTASVSAGAAYTVEKSQVFTTGPMEDAVVFTTIPYDRYTYAVVSHPDPEMVGGEVVVSLPREPVILKVERDFYNANVVGSNVSIGANVFDHTVGDVSTYPSPARKDSLLSTYGGLENGPIGVGQGGGSSGLSIDVSNEVSLGGTLGIEVEREVEVTSGPVMAGFSVGYGVEASLSVTSGQSTTYSVTVGDLSPDDFADNQYSYGIFTYVQGIDDQEFEVVNFWIQ